MRGRRIAWLVCWVPAWKGCSMLLLVSVAPQQRRGWECGLVLFVQRKRKWFGEHSAFTGLLLCWTGVGRAEMHTGEASRGPSVSDPLTLHAGSPTPMQAGCGVLGHPGSLSWLVPRGQHPISGSTVCSNTEYKHHAFCFLFSFGYIFNYTSRASLLYSERCSLASGAPGVEPWALSQTPGPQLLGCPPPDPFPAQDQPLSKPVGTIRNQIQGHRLRVGHLPALTRPRGEVCPWPLEKSEQKA